MNEKCRILLIEDHPLMRSGIRALITDSSSFGIVGEAGTLKEARELLKKTVPDIVLLDISLPDGVGFELMPDLAQSHPESRVVVLTMHREDPYLIKAIRDGAWGFVVKDMAPDRLIKTLESVRSGEKCFFTTHASASGTEATIDASADVFESKNAEPRVSLSKRENYVMKALARGEPLTEIANHLGISVKTVFTYRVRILQKLNLKTNSDIIRYAIAHGLDK